MSPAPIGRTPSASRSESFQGTRVIDHLGQAAVTGTDSMRAVLDSWQQPGTLGERLDREGILGTLRCKP